jgi:hypothetical protein
MGDGGIISNFRLTISDKSIFRLMIDDGRFSISEARCPMHEARVQAQGMMNKEDIGFILGGYRD